MKSMHHPEGSSFRAPGASHSAVGDAARSPLLADTKESAMPTTRLDLCHHCQVAVRDPECMGFCPMCFGEMLPEGPPTLVFDARAVLLPSGKARVLITCTDGRHYEWRMPA